MFGDVPGDLGRGLRRGRALRRDPKAKLELASPESPFVVTRPAPDHRNLMVRLGKAGVSAIHCPAFEIAPAAGSLLDELVNSLRTFDFIIVTSPVAARLVAARAMGPGMRELQFFAPGQGTARVLRAAGLRCRFPNSGGTSEHLLAMPDLAEAVGARVAIVGAPGGRGLLESEIARRGARVEPVHVYRRNPLAPAAELIAALRQGREPVVLISSRQAFDSITNALCDEARPAWLSARFVVSSERLEKACSAAGISRIRRADGASDERMLAAAAEAGWISRLPGCHTGRRFPLASSNDP